MPEKRRRSRKTHKIACVFVLLFEMNALAAELQLFVVQSKCQYIVQHMFGRATTLTLGALQPQQQQVPVVQLCNV